MTDIKIPADQWGAMIGAAVLQSVTHENRDFLIKEAIQHLLNRDTRYGSDNRSPLQRAFDDAACQTARKIIAADLEASGDLTSKIHQLIVDAVDKATTGENRIKLVDAMATAISQAFKMDRY